GGCVFVGFGFFGWGLLVCGGGVVCGVGVFCWGWVWFWCWWWVGFFFGGVGLVGVGVVLLWVCCGVGCVLDWVW
ncbi:hypothetical protein ACQ9A5_25165, partial [Escherichia coli]|uniref:hypothetical protein n=1 Tax=Escherichia coli TaxID=562 RepID=UPI003D35BFA0